MAEPHLVSIIDEGGNLREYYATSQPAPIETEYFVLEDDAHPHITGLFFFACTLGIFATILWIGAIVMSLRLKRRRELIAQQERLELEMRSNINKIQRERKVMAAILTRKITKVTDEGGIIELSEWQHEKTSKAFTPEEDLEKNNSENDSNEQVNSSEKTPTVEVNNEDADVENQNNKVIEEREQVSDEKEEKAHCSICLTEFRLGDELSWSRDLKCKHVFHSECLIPWLMKNNECPFCRENIVEDDNDVSKDKEGEENNSTASSTTTDGKKNLVTVNTTVSEGKENGNFSTRNFFVRDGLISIAKKKCYNSLPSELPKNVQENSEDMLERNKNTPSHERQCEDQDEQEHAIVQKGCRRKKRISSKTYTAVMNEETDSIV